MIGNISLSASYSLRSNVTCVLETVTDCRVLCMGILNVSRRLFLIILGHWDNLAKWSNFNKNIVFFLDIVNFGLNFKIKNISSKRAKKLKTSATKLKIVRTRTSNCQKKIKDSQWLLFEPNKTDTRLTFLFKILTLFLKFSLLSRFLGK